MFFFHNITPKYKVLYFIKYNLTEKAFSFKVFLPFFNIFGVFLWFLDGRVVAASELGQVLILLAGQAAILSWIFGIFARQQSPSRA